MKIRKMTLDEIHNESSYFAETHDMTADIHLLVDVENAGFCKDGVTRWYLFKDGNGDLAIYYKH